MVYEIVCALLIERNNEAEGVHSGSRLGTAFKAVSKQSGDDDTDEENGGNTSTVQNGQLDRNEA